MKKTSPLRTTIEALIEKGYELYFWLSGRLKRESKNHSSIIEEFSIAVEHMNNETVTIFLEERKRVAERNGYRMRIRYDYNKRHGNEIGKVTLSCRGKDIEEATLTTDMEQRAIFWIFSTHMKQ